MKIDAKKSVLLVIDMQNDFYADGFNAAQRGKQVGLMQTLPEKINTFAAEVRLAGARVVFTKFVYDPARSPWNFSEITEATKNSNWMCRAGTEGAKLAGVLPAAEDTIIEKLSYDSFAGTPLLQLCKDWGVENILITGVRTEICVMNTASRAFAEGFRTFVVSDLVGTYDDKTDVANAVLSAVGYGGYVMPSQELKKLIA